MPAVLVRGPADVVLNHERPTVEAEHLVVVTPLSRDAQQFLGENQVAGLAVPPLALALSEYVLDPAAGPVPQPLRIRLSRTEVDHRRPVVGLEHPVLRQVRHRGQFPRVGPGPQHTRYAQTRRPLDGEFLGTRLVADLAQDRAPVVNDPPVDFLRKRTGHPQGQGPLHEQQISQPSARRQGQRGEAAPHGVVDAMSQRHAHEREVTVRMSTVPAVSVQPPSGTVTFLFTDIEDSTRLWESTPADMAAAVQAHDVIVRSAIERHGGHVFATGGDGFCAAFSSAVDAVTAAIESQRELGGDDAIPFAVRMALHTGEAIERDRNYYGAEVNRAARLMALAHGGQVLVSDTAEVLVRSRVALRPLGEHLLRGLRGTIPVFQVMADGLPSEFPVLRSVDHFAGNLPRQVSSLVGRDAEVDDVAELVRSQRLVTLTGVGGVGKTRLAIEVGAELAGEFDDGVWIVELAGVGDPGAVPAALATVLGITPQSDVPLIDTVADTVAGRRMLLVVDNCEHLRDSAAAAIEAILGRAGHTKVLATSREAVGVPGESVATVSPLATEGGVTSDAVTLFVERARSARHDFELQDPQTAAAVTEICETVDGLPLGIELAAARMAAMSAIEVRDRLADRFRLLQRGAPGPERQLTLRHAVEWSYDLLTDDERSLLRTASVFAGGFDLSSICAVVDDADEIDVLRHLDSLVRKSLVVADHSAATTRYGAVRDDPAVRRGSTGRCRRA